MDLGEVGLLLVTRGEEEARAAIDRYIRKSDELVQKMDANGQKADAAYTAYENTINKQIKAHTQLIDVAASLRRSYEDLSASFSKMDKATLDYYRTEEMLQKGMAAGVVTGTEYARVMELVQQRLIEVAGSIRIQDEEARLALQEKSNAEIEKARLSYDSIVGSIDKVHAANTRLSDSQKRINEAFTLGAISQDEFNHAQRMVQEQYDKDNPSERLRALDDEKRKQAEATAEKERLARAYDRLNASINPAIRGQQQFDAAMKTLNDSLAKEIISLDQYNRSVDDLRVTLERTGHTVNQFGQVMSKSERDVAKFARGGMQQLGYQVGDFAVQVQGGTSMLVAFGQQGAQLAGIFGATGAVIGAGIAIVTSLAHAYLVAHGEGKTLIQTTSDMESSFQTLNSTLDDLISNDFASTFGDLSDDIRRMTEAALELDSAMSLKNMIDTLDKLKSEYIEPGMFQKTLSMLPAALANQVGGVSLMSAGADLGSTMMSSFTQENYDKLGFDMGYEAFDNYKKGIDAASQSGDLSEVTRLISQMYVDAVPDAKTFSAAVSSGGYDMLEIYRKLALATADAIARRKEYEEGRPIQTEMVIAKERGHMEAIASATDYASKAAYRRYQEESKVVDVIDKISKKMVEQRGHAEAIRSAQDEGSVGAYDRYVRDREHAEKLIAGVRQQGIEQYRAYQKTMDQDRMSDENLIITARQRGIDQYRADQRALDQDRLSDERLISAARQQGVEEYRAYQKATDQDRLSDEKLISAARKQDVEQYRAYQQAANQDRMSDEKLIADARKRADDEAQRRYRDHAASRMSDENLINTARQQGIEQYRAYQKAMDQDRRADDKLIQDALVKSLMDAYKAGEDLTKLDLALGIDGAAIVAENLAKQLGISLATARAIVGLGAAAAPQIVYDPRDPRYDAEKAKIGRLGAIMGGAPVYTPPASPVTGEGSGTSSGVSRDAMAELRAQIALEREMLDLTKDQQRVYSALGDERSKYSQIELDALAAEIKSLEDKKKTIADMQSISNTVQSSMSDAFMSMVDGTMEVEDAFRNMSRAIIAQLYQVMVVQRVVGQYDAATKTGTGLAGSLMKLISSATVPAAAQAQGGAWSGGSQVVAYANGGIVTTPTMFDMSGGRRGLMGEAGPEAILPLSRASNGKLGVAVSGGGTNAVSEHVNISNVFNVTGSDAETVRREINKALPRISEVTKASVLDARRRGGKMLATFG